MPALLPIILTASHIVFAGFALRPVPIYRHNKSTVP